MSEYTPEINEFMDFVGSILGSVNVKVALTKEEWELVLEAMEVTYKFVYLDDDAESFIRNKAESVKQTMEQIKEEIAGMSDDSDISIEMSTREFANLECSVEFAGSFTKNQLKPALKIFNFLDDDNTEILDDKVEEFKQLSKELTSKFNMNNVDLDSMTNALGFLNI